MRPPVSRLFGPVDLPPPLSASFTPANQTVSRTGAGGVSAGVTLNISGGVPPYTSLTTAPGMSVTGAASTTPGFSVGLSAGQDSTFNISATVNDSAGSPAATASGTIRATASSPPPTLTASFSPGSQIASRTGAGPVSAGVSFNIGGGGGGPYQFSTSGGGMTVSGGTTSSPSFSTTLTNGQDTTFTVSGTVTDLGTGQTASCSATIECKSTAVATLGVTISPDPVTVHKAGGGSYIITFTATPINNVGAVTYSWSTGSHASTGVVSGNVAANDEIDGLISVTITDPATGQTASYGTTWTVLGF